MKVLVGVKRVVDYSVHIRVKADESGIETTNVKMAINPFDEIAVEEAVRLKEKKQLAEIIVVSIGNTACQETLRQALAIGADRAILVDTSAEIQPLAAARILQKLIEKEAPDLVILGKQAIDTDNNQTGQMLAGLLNWSQGTFVSKVELQDDRAIVTREIDGGLETLSLRLPSVITTDLRLNEPRYLSLPNIVQAKRKPMTIIPLSDLQIDAVSRIKTLKVTMPKKRGAGVKVANVQELLDKLKQEAKVLS